MRKLVLILFMSDLIFKLTYFFRNIVSTANLACKLDLKKIALQAKNAEYNPKVSLLSIPSTLSSHLYLLPIYSFFFLKNKFMSKQPLATQKLNCLILCSEVLKNNLLLYPE